MQSPTDNIAAMKRLADDAFAQQRWFYYAKAAGMFLPNYEEDNFYSEQQEVFFLEYEAQLELDRVFGNLDEA
jgi:hypothetical protein